MSLWQDLTPRYSLEALQVYLCHVLLIIFHSISDQSTCASCISDSYVSEKTCKFIPACVHLDAKKYNCDHVLCIFLSRGTEHLRGCSVTDLHNLLTSASALAELFFPHNTEKLCHISDKRASLQPQMEKFWRDWLFWRRFPPKTGPKKLQFICKDFLTFRPFTKEPGN